MQQGKLSTSKVMVLGLIFAILANIPFYMWIFNVHWSWATGFPLGWIGVGMTYMGTFFHEIGHTIFMWFYGYPTVPTFDFEHGGGMAWALTGQQTVILIAIWSAMAYGLFALCEYRILQIGIIALAVLNVSLAFNHYHAVVLDFMGPAMVCFVASFFIYRALLDSAPRGDFERFLNAFFGLGLIIQVGVNGYGLLNETAYRLVYYQQKGSHGFGDFDKIADRLTFLNFNGVVSLWLIINVICLVVPFVLYLRANSYDNKWE